MKKFIILISCVLVAYPAFTQVEINGINTIVITFDATLMGVNEGQYTGIGFQSSPSTGSLDSDAFATSGMSDGSLVFGGTGPGNDHGRGTSTGGVITGGFYAFNVGGNHCLGFQPSANDFTPGTLTLRIKNNTGSVLNGFNFSYLLKNLNDENRSTSISFSHSPDNISFNPESTLDFISTETAGTPPVSWQTFGFTLDISGLSVPIDGFYYLKWTTVDEGGSGSRDEFGLDNITFSNIALILPVELEYFRAELEASATNLTWQTASELNNAHFSIERSTNGFDFKEIGQVAGSGTTTETHNYEFVDPAPAKGINYYRLKQQDFDGKFEYSRIVSIFADHAENQILLYPTLAANEIHLRFPATSYYEGSIQIFDLSGRMVMERLFETEEAELTIPIHDLMSGQYMVRVQHGPLFENLRFVRQ